MCVYLCRCGVMFFVKSQWHLVCPKDRWFFPSSQQINVFTCSQAFFSFFCFLHAEQSCFQPPSGLFFMKNQSKSQWGTFQTTSSPGGRWWSQSKHQGCEAVMNHKVDKDRCPHPFRKDFEEGDVIRFILYFILGKVNVLIPSNCECCECKWDLNGIFWTEGIGEGEIGWPA